jgi:hypothetical protein
MTIQEWKNKMNKATLSQCDEVLDKIRKAKKQSPSGYYTHDNIIYNIKYSDFEGWVNDRKRHIRFLSDLLGWEGGIK